MRGARCERTGFEGKGKFEGSKWVLWRLLRWGLVCKQDELPNDPLLGTMLWKIITGNKVPIEEALSHPVVVVCLGDGGMAMMRVESAKPEPCRVVGMAWDEGPLLHKQAATVRLC